MFLDDAEDSRAVGLARKLDVEGPGVQLEQHGEQLCVVHVQAVRRIHVPARTRVNADTPSFILRESLDHCVVEVDEGPQHLLRRIELERQPSLREVDLDDVGSLAEAFPDVGHRLTHEILEERLLRVTPDSLLRVKEAQSRGGDHRLLDGNLRIPLGPVEVRRSIGLVPERPRGQAWQLTGVAIGEGDGNAVGREVLESLDRVGGEAGLGLLSVADDGGSGLLESVDGVPDGRVVQLPELLFGAPALIEFPDTAQELRRSRNAADWLGGYGHGSHSPSGSGSAPRQPRFLARGYLHHGWGRHVRQGTDVVPGKVEHGSLGEEQFELLV